MKKERYKKFKDDKDIDLPTWSEQLDKILEKRKMTYDDLYIKSKKSVAKSTISGWINGTEPKAISIINVAKALGVSSDYLLGLTNVESPEANIQAMHNYTGLDENAIKELNELKNAKHYDIRAWIGIINFLFDNGSFYQFIENLQNYKQQERSVWMAERYNDSVEDDEPKKKRGIRLGTTREITKEDVNDIHLFKANRIAVKIAEDYIEF